MSTYVDQTSLFPSGTLHSPNIAVDWLRVHAPGLPTDFSHDGSTHQDVVAVMRVVLVIIIMHHHYHHQKNKNRKKNNKQKQYCPNERDSAMGLKPYRQMSGRLKKIFKRDKSETANSPPN